MSLVEAIEWTQSILGVKEGAILISLAEVGMEMRLEGKSTDERTGKFVFSVSKKFLYNIHYDLIKNVVDIVIEMKSNSCH